jgi:hypothetical protein
MDNRGKPYSELKRTGAGPIPFHSIEEVKLWREQQNRAGRPSSLDDFYLAHHLRLDCKATGIANSPVGFDGDIPLFEQCEVCSGTGKLINPSI